MPPALESPVHLKILASEAIQDTDRHDAHNLLMWLVQDEHQA